MDAKRVLSPGVSALLAAFVGCATLGRAQASPSTVKINKFAAAMGLAMEQVEVNTPPSAAASGAGPRGEAHVFRLGEEVITANGDYGDIDGIGPGDMLHVYLFSNTTTFENADTLTRTAGCRYGFCVGNDIITANGDYGRIDGVGPHGKLHVYRYSGSNTFEDAATLSRR